MSDEPKTEAFESRIRRIEAQVTALAEDVRRLDDWRHDRGSCCQPSSCRQENGAVLSDAVRRLIVAVDRCITTWHASEAMFHAMEALERAREEAKGAGL